MKPMVDPLTWEEFLALPEKDREVLRRQCLGDPWGAPTPGSPAERTQRRVRRIARCSVDRERIDAIAEAS